MPELGQREFGGTDRFSILRRLGEGAFGVVYEAFDHKRNIPVALKTLSRVDAASLGRFKQEFRSLADVTHPNLVVLYEFLSYDEQWFFTMELVNGVHVLKYVREDTLTNRSIASSLSPGSGYGDPSDASTIADARGWSAARPHPAPSPPSLIQYDRLRDVFTQLSEGICALHQAGMLHRDIKPSNVMVTHEGRVVLLDFGLVAEMGPERTQTVHIVGTPSYMSPEQAATGTLTEASDWYSVGAMLYEAATGRLPFTGKVLEVLTAKQKTEPPPPVSIAPNVPKDLNDLCQELLRLDPALRPIGKDVIARLGGVHMEQRRRSSSRSRHSGVFLGRESHLKSLHEAYESARSGRSVTVFIHGHSGIGKTALVRRFLDEVEEKDAVVLTGRCYERESVPYKAIDNLIDSLAHHLKRLSDEQVDRFLPRHILALARLFPVLRDVAAVNVARRRVPEIPDSQELRRRAFAALRDLFGRMVENNPLILYIDDLQWGDLDSGALLEELVRAPDAPALLLLASYRSEEVQASPLLQRLLDFRSRSGADIDIRELPVGELTSAEASSVALALMGDHGTSEIARAGAIALESGGNPFFIGELAQYQREDHEDLATLDEVIHQRVSRLPDEIRRLLEVVAVAGQPVDRHVARKAAGLKRDDHVPLGLLRSQHLIRVVGSDQIETYHDRIREAVASHLMPAAVQEVHHRLALAWEAVGADPETLAVHFHGAGESDRAAQYATLAAGRAAGALAFERAARFYRMALELRPEEKTRRNELLVSLGDALANAGRGAEAAQAYQAAAENTNPAQAIDLERRAAEQLLFAGHIVEGRAAARAVLGRVGMYMPATPRSSLLSLLYHRARLLVRGLKFRERRAEDIPAEDLLRIDTCRSLALVLGLYDVIAGTEFHARHLLLALKAGEPYRIARALAAELAYSAVGGTRARAGTARLQRIADDLVANVQDSHALGLLKLNTGVARFLEARFHDGADLLERAEAIFREKCTGVICELDTGVIFWMFCLIHLGGWVKLGPRVPELLKDAEERGDLYASVAIRARILYLLYLVADDPDRARQEERDVRQHCSGAGFESPHYWTWLARTETALYEGRSEDAWAEVERQWGAFAGSLLTRVQTVYIESHHMRARCAIAVGRLDQAEREVRIIEREQNSWGNAKAGMIRATLTARHDRVSAAAIAHAAEQTFRAAHIHHYAAAAARYRGALLGGEQGRRLIQLADSEMASHQIRNPERMAAMLVPGPWPVVE